MNKDKDLSKDLYVLRKNKDDLFLRPLVNQKKLKNIITGKEVPHNHHGDLFDYLNDTDISDQFEESTFGEYLSERIEVSDLTLQEVADTINIHIELLYDILDEEKFPWYIPVESLKRLCSLLNLSTIEIVKQIKAIGINESNINNSLLNNYAARSQDGISSSKLKGSLYDANVKIAIDREKEKRDSFIASLTK